MRKIAVGGVVAALGMMAWVVIELGSIDRQLRSAPVRAMIEREREQDARIRVLEEMLERANRNRGDEGTASK